MQPEATRRVGVIEVGSRALRLLVADVGRRSLAVVRSDWEETQLAVAVSKKSGLTEKMHHMREVLDRFIRRAGEFGADDIIVFGTEAVRKLADVDPEALAILGPRLQVLDRGTEARCSLAAAIIGLPQLADAGAIMVLDQGAGSLELAVGRLNDTVEVEDSRRYALGTDALVRKLHQSSDSLEKFENVLNAQIEKYRLPDQSPEAVVILGSAATKCAWLKVRGGDVSRPYDSKSVHGEVITLMHVTQLLDMAKLNPTAVRSLIDPRHPESSEYETVIAGLMAIRLFLYHLRRTTFTVSGLGTRYGVAALLGRGAIDSERLRLKR